MDTYQVTLLGLITISGFNAYRFEQKISSDKNDIRDLIKIRNTIEESQPKNEPELAKATRDIGLLSASIALQGNWLPSRYRQFLLAGVLELIIAVIFKSSKCQICAFITYCLLFSTAGLRFWIGIFAR